MLFRSQAIALCKRYEVDASKRNVHGALIDSELLARVYLAMTGGQTALSLDDDDAVGALLAARQSQPKSSSYNGPNLDLVVIHATEDEAAAHDAMLEKLRAEGDCVWDRVDKH